MFRGSTAKVNSVDAELLYFILIYVFYRYVKGYTLDG